MPFKPVIDSNPPVKPKVNVPPVVRPIVLPQVQANVVQPDPVLNPQVQEPVPTTTKPGDLILVRVINWWDSGQIQRAATGIFLAALPGIYDLFTGTSPFTLRGLVSALIMGLFAWMGVKRAASPDVLTGNTALDASNIAATTLTNNKIKELQGKK